MSKKKPKKTAIADSADLAGNNPRRRLGYEEMLSELEAIVADAEIRLQDEENAA
nr:Uncharacterised protein [Raoultella sp. NCTC 9187]